MKLTCPPDPDHACKTCLEWFKHDEKKTITVMWLSVMLVVMGFLGYTVGVEHEHQKQVLHQRLSMGCVCKGG